MPYFERLPYAEMLRQAAGLATPPKSIPTASKPTILDRAAAILKEEATGLPPSTRRPTLPFPAADTHRDKTAARHVLLLDPPPPIKAGQKAAVLLSIVNDSETSLTFSVVPTHLVSRCGARIPANNIEISPEEAVLAPAESADVQVEVNIPEIIIPGEYSGLLQVYGQQTARAVLVINVTN